MPFFVASMEMAITVRHALVATTLQFRLRSTVGLVLDDSIR
jgi:hypothetical protein